MRNSWSSFWETWSDVEGRKTVVVVMQISIIIPVYNVEKYLNRFLNCLKHQTVQNFIAIFIIDKSPDKSIELIRSEKDFFKERLVLIENEENKGLSETRNVGLDYVAKHPTKYITFLDPDDWMDTDYLEDLYENAEKYDLDLCISGLIRFNETNNRTICTEMVKMRTEIFDSPAKCDELAYINPCAYAKLYRFEPIKELRVRSIKRSEDTCYLFEALKVYNRIKFTNNARYHYCVRGASLTGMIDEDKYLSMHKGFAQLLPDFEKKGFEGIRDEFVTQIFIRSSLGGVCRLCFSNIKKAHYMEKREYDYLQKYVPSWRKNKYLSFGNKGIGSKKEFALRVCALMYKLHIFFVFVWFYSLYTQVLGKDVRA